MRSHCYSSQSLNVPQPRKSSTAPLYVLQLVLGLDEAMSSLKPDIIMTQRAAWKNIRSLQNPKDGGRNFPANTQKEPLPHNENFPEGYQH